MKIGKTHLTQLLFLRLPMLEHLNFNFWNDDGQMDIIFDIKGEQTPVLPKYNKLPGLNGKGLAKNLPMKLNIF